MKSNILRITGGALAAGMLAGVSACVQLFDHSHDIKVRPVVEMQDSKTSAGSEYLSAVAAIKSRDYATALEYLQAARARDPQNIRVLNAFGVVYDKLGRFDLSARYYAEASALDPKSAIVAKNMAYSRSLQGMTAPAVSQLASNRQSSLVVARVEVQANAISPPAESPAPTLRTPQWASSQPANVSVKLAATEPRLMVSSPPAINASVTPVSKMASSKSEPVPVTEVSNIQPAPAPRPPVNVTPLTPKSRAAPSLPQAAPVKQASKLLPTPAPLLLASVTPLTPKSQTAPSQPQAVPVKRVSNMLALAAQRLPSPARTLSAPQAASIAPMQPPAKRALTMQVALNSPGGTTSKTRSTIPAGIKAAADPRPATSVIAVQPTLIAVVNKTTIRPSSTQQILSSAPTVKAAIPNAFAVEHLPPAAVTPATAVKSAPDTKAVLTKPVLLTGYPLVVTDAPGKIDAVQLVRQNLAILGWTISRNIPSPIRSQPVTTLLYPPSSVAVAHALARTLPFPTRLTANACNCGLKLVVGSDFSGWKTVQPHNPDPRTKKLSVASISDNRPVGVR